MHIHCEMKCPLYCDVDCTTLQIDWIILGGMLAMGELYGIWVIPQYSCVWNTQKILCLWEELLRPLHSQSHGCRHMMWGTFTDLILQRWEPAEGNPWGHRRLRVERRSCDMWQLMWRLLHFISMVQRHVCLWLCGCMCQCVCVCVSVCVHVHFQHWRRVVWGHDQTITLSAQDKVEIAKQGADHAEATVVSWLRDKWGQGLRHGRDGENGWFCNTNRGMAIYWVSRGESRLHRKEGWRKALSSASTTGVMSFANTQSM